MLEPNDRNRKAVKDAVTAYNDYLDEAEEFIKERIEQERIAEEQRKEQERLDAERKQLEEEKAAASEPAPTTDTVDQALSAPPVPPEEARENVEKIMEGSNPTPPPSETTLEPSRLDRVTTLDDLYEWIFLQGVLDGGTGGTMESVVKEAMAHTTKLIESVQSGEPVSE